MSKYWLQILFCVPAFMLFVLFFVRNVLGWDVSIEGGQWLILMNVVFFAACVAFAFLDRRTKAWRYAALFNSWIFIMALIASILGFGS